MEALALILYVIIILISISIHEFAHAKAADVLGDPTPRLSGRLTLNPLAHLDPIGFLMLLIIRIGWAKPVPINPYNFKNPNTGMMIVGLAGPFSNFIIAWVLAIFLRNIPAPHYLWYDALTAAIWINLALMVFNLLPIPPLDGSRIFTQYLPVETQMYLERYGFIILVFILLFPPTQQLLMLLIGLLYRLIA
jgi:Zn-dependent protease